MYLYISGIDCFSLHKRLKLVSSSVFRKIYVARGKEMSNFFTDDIEIYSDHSKGKTLMKKIKYINLFLKEIRKVKINKLHKLGTLKFLPEI